MNLVALDCTWLMHRAFYVNPNHCVSMVIGWVCRYSQELNSTHILACVDTGKSFRKDLDPLYKANRSGKSVVHEAVDDLMRRLPKIGIAVHASDGNETDDVLATVGYKSKRSILVTSDKDNLQCVSDRCSIYIPSVGGRPEKHINLSNFLEFSNGLSPSQFLDWQTLTGDKIDNIPKLLQPAVSRKLILKHKSLRKYLETKEGAAWAKKNEIRLRLNRKLVKLKTDCFELDLKRYRRPLVNTGYEPSNNWYKTLVG